MPTSLATSVDCFCHNINESTDDIERFHVSALACTSTHVLFVDPAGDRGRLALVSLSSRHAMTAKVTESLSPRTRPLIG
jgi:hypothetical protein